MMYFGGKTRLGRHIARAALDDAKVKDPKIVDLCAGALGTTIGFVREGVTRIHAIDAHLPLVNMWKAALDGWQPPSQLDEAKYNVIKRDRDPSDPLTAFAGFCCSFMGKYFDTYAKNKCGYDYCGGGRRSILRKVKLLKEIDFTLECARVEDFTARPGWVHYVDPPYKGTTGYSVDPPPDIWVIAERWAKVAPVYISEYNGPHTEIWSAPALANQLTKPGAIERLFRV
jgi:DNA adenine methylase